jgi:RND family efflux transporter MFP subunit
LASKKQVLLPFIVLIMSVSIALSLSAMKSPIQTKEEKIALPLVEITNLTSSSQQLDVESYGIVNPKYSTELVAQVTGQVISLSDQFVKGGFVKKGVELARIDPNDYEAALIEAQANLAQANAAYIIEQAQADAARKQWERLKRSSKSTSSDLYLRKPQLAEKFAQYRAAQASVKRAKRNLERTYIKAPYDAIIQNRSISMGSVINTGSKLGLLYSVSVAEIRLPIPDSELKYLINDGIGADVTLSTQSSSIDAQVWRGEIVRTEGVIDENNRMMFLVAQIEKPYNIKPHTLKFGKYVNASISGKSLNNIITLPYHLIKNSKVATLDENSQLAFKKVNVIRVVNGVAFIDKGIEDNTQLITTSIEYPSSGMTLKVSPNSSAGSLSSTPSDESN